MSFLYIFNVIGVLDNVTYRVLQEEVFEWYTSHQLYVWLMWLLIPVIVIFCLPFFTYFLLYITALLLEVYRYWNLARGIKYNPKFWDKANFYFSNIWLAYGRFWHGYEVVGIDNIPSQGPALIIFYHGTIPVDWYFLFAAHVCIKKRLIQAVGDKFLFKIPGWRALLECAKVCPGSIESCSEVLKNGNLLAIAPGGVREAQFGDETYSLLWEKRKGFAQVAIEGKAPIIPVFTQNIREAFRPLGIGKSLFRKIYEKTRFPLVPIYGGFPVKLRTIIGNPIPYDKNVTAEELVCKTKCAIRELILHHQHLPGSIILALFERIFETNKQKCI
ncbi:DGAT1/2-independent enzyme synthesizing storage lipids-like [Centruroides vittatus]|uniref:DGAT1/2-independent enzyme synthesizing storage lipids-like n=1 Tax=Centruroides vittatus TaxID=120091 RepID=UPI00350F7F83